MCAFAPPKEDAPGASSLAGFGLDPTRIRPGIWTKKHTKFSILLWTLRWGFLLSFKALRQWGIQVPGFCTLFVGRSWSYLLQLWIFQGMSHSYFCCMRKKSNIPTLLSLVLLGVILDLEIIHSFSKSSNCWKFYWVLFGSLCWHL